MAAKAHISTGWKVRVGAMAFLITGMSIWFLMDGFVGYPAQREIYDEYAVFVEQNKNMPQEAFIEAWNKYANEKKLPAITRDPKELEGYNKTDGSILTQKLLGFGTLPLAALTIWYFLGLFKKWIATEEDGVYTNRGSVGWDQIEKLDKTRWPKKGIAFLLYKQGENAGRLRIDDFWYDRDPTDKIMREIEDKLSDEQITGDIRETERDKRKAEKKAAEEAAAKDKGDAAKEESKDESTEKEAATTATDA